jgi:pre-mRNA-splicing factor ATP-dependent RNA helicase DHX38/PRP16
MTAKQQQIKRENELWENNRLSRSGMCFIGFIELLTLFLGVVQYDQELDDAFDPETDENIATLLVHNIVPPFLDGRIVFTKQAQPIVPVSILSDRKDIHSCFRSKMSRPI